MNMSRSGYDDDCDYDGDAWEFIRWRGQVASAIRGKRGQEFLREMIEALDAMPSKQLISHELQAESEAAEVAPMVCAIGSVGLKRGVDMRSLDPDDYCKISETFGIAHQLAREIEYMNDEWKYGPETPEDRWLRMRDWAARQITPVKIVL
jgi:hypothetical protein